MRTKRSEISLNLPTGGNAIKRKLASVILRWRGAGEQEARIAAIAVNSKALEPPLEEPPLPIKPVIFEQLMICARDIATKNPVGLPSLIVAILRPLQSEQILSVAERVDNTARSEITTARFFSENFYFSLFDGVDCAARSAEQYRLRLSKHMVLPTTWEKSSFVSTVADIGTGKRQSCWRQDPNHRITLLLPWGIGVVDGGNHSIAAGILAGEGELTPTAVFDFSPALARYRCEGVKIIETATGQTVGEMHDERFAAVFEIGRLMLPYGEALHPLA